MMHSSYEEWLADFGARAFSSQDLERLLTRSRQQSDDDLRRLVKQHQTLRRLVHDVLVPKVDDSRVPPTLADRQLIDLVRSIVGDANGGSAA